MRLMKKNREQMKDGPVLREWENSKSEEKNKQNETLLKFHSMIMCVYFLVLLLTVYITNNFIIFIFCLPCFLAYCVSFYLSYRVNSEWLLIFNYCLTTVFIIGFVIVFGWDCGVQHFIFVMVVLVFATHKGSTRQKMVLITLLYLLRIVLYAYTLIYSPLYEITKLMGVCFQVINSIAIFITMCSCLHQMTLGKREMEAKLEEMSARIKRFDLEDSLTGLLNRKSMMDYLEALTESISEEDERNICIAVGDVDYFGKVNDRYGHNCGDIVIKQLGYQFLQFMKDKGQVSRWSGEEFLFVFENAAGEDAYYYLTKLQQQIRATEFFFKDENISITMTYGLMEYNPDKNIDYCIMEADKKMLMGKESGRNTIIY